MSSPFQNAGAQNSKPTKYAPIWTNRWFTGLWTQRNPLRDAATPYLAEKYYSGSRFDSLLAGFDIEITPRLTLARRCGLSVYNSQTFNSINRFYEFRMFTGATENIRVIADTQTTIYDATGPSTKTLIKTKSPGAPAFFQSVGNLLYFSWAGGVPQKWDGTTTYQMGITAPVNAPVLSPTTSATRGWFKNEVVPTNTVILDSNGNGEFAFTGGTTGSTIPTWPTKQYTQSLDGTVRWTCLGPPVPWVAGNAAYAGEFIIDNNGNFQMCTTSGTSGATAPAWNVALGGTTTDGTAIWTNRGTATVVVNNTHGYVYAYHSVDGAVSTASPAAFTGPVLGINSITVAGTGSSDPQVDFVWIFRTVDGGSTFLFLAQVTNTGSWTYVDTLPDAALNEFLQAGINHQNDPPPIGLTALTYHLNLIWGAVGNTVYYSRSQDASTAGVSAESFPPNNYFIFPSAVTRMVPAVFGLLVFTISDIYLIQGTNTANSPLFASPFLSGIGLAHYDALTTNGSLIYMMTTDAQTISLDPNSGVSEVGCPIGDTLSDLFNPGTSFVTYHNGGSADKGLFVADNGTRWFRLTTVNAPETGQAWSPQARPNAAGGGFSAVQSVETTPGKRQLLLGPPFTTGPILYRDTNVFTDNGTPYVCGATVGAIVLAQPGELAEMGFIAADYKGTGHDPSIFVLLDDINFAGEQLVNSVPEPPNLPLSVNIVGKRWYFSQAAAPAWCRYVSISFVWEAFNTADELYSYTIFGAHWNMK